MLWIVYYLNLKDYQKAQFSKWDVGIKNAFLSLPFSRKFDVITMQGVHPIFDDLYWLDNCISGIKSDGFIILFSIFNPYPYDVIMRVKQSGMNDWQPGWNVHSKNLLKIFAKKRISS